MRGRYIERLENPMKINELYIFESEMISDRFQIGYRSGSDQIFRFSIKYEFILKNTDRFPSL
jgi:hypothetical protein